MSDVPLEHLDFQYIRECKNGNEVERILKALRYETKTTWTCGRYLVFTCLRPCRSGKEAGHYPDLIEFAEKRLRELKPKR